MPRETWQEIAARINAGKGQGLKKMIVKDDEARTEGEFHEKLDAMTPEEISGSEFKLNSKLAEISAHNLTAQCHGNSVAGGWWHDLITGEHLRGKRNVPEMLMLIVSEVAEGMEGYRKNKMDDHLPHRSMLEVELADAVIRIFDTAGGLGLDVAGAIAEKLSYNASRQDHKPENRRKEGGKAF